MKIAILAPDKALTDEVQSALGAIASGDNKLDVMHGALALVDELGQKAPDVAILHSVCNVDADLAIIERALQHAPAMAVIVLATNAAPSFLLGAMHAGVRDVLELPLQPTALRAAVRRLERHGNVSGSTAKRKMIAFIACKGGSGATFIATNLGYVLATSGVNTALLDLNLQFGDAALFLSDKPPANTLADVAGANIARLDASFLAAAMVEILPNYAVLAAPDELERASEVRPEHVSVLLELASGQYDFVLLDLGRSLDAVSVQALDAVDLIFLVVQQTLPFLRDTKRMIAALTTLGYPKSKLRLVVNRYEKRSDITLEDIEKAIGLPVFKAVPNSYDAVSAAVNQGVAISVIAPHDPVTRALQELAAELTEKPATKKDHWYGHLVNR